MHYHDWLIPVEEIAVEAGNEILEIYGTEFDVDIKSDQSPLTAADLAAHCHIVAALESLTPDIPILSEESVDIGWEERRSWDPYWLVDPLDGTKEFVKRNGEFTVNIALIQQHRPVLGVVHVPVTGKTYSGSVSDGAFLTEAGERRAIQVRALSGKPVVVGSRSHAGESLQIFLDKLGEYDMSPMGSSLKFCLVAEGSADIYPRLGLTSEWDTAAAQAVVEAAGGQVVDLEGASLRYNTGDHILNPHFLVVADTSVDWLQYLPDEQ